VTPGGPIHADVGWQCFAALVTVAVVAPEGSTYMQELRRGANATAGVDVSLAVVDNYGDAELGLSRYPSVYQVRESEIERERNREGGRESGEGTPDGC